MLILEARTYNDCCRGYTLRYDPAGVITRLVLGKPAGVKSDDNPAGVKSDDNSADNHKPANHLKPAPVITRQTVITGLPRVMKPETL